MSLPIALGEADGASAGVAATQAPLPPPIPCVGWQQQAMAAGGGAGLHRGRGRPAGDNRPGSNSPYLKVASPATSGRAENVNCTGRAELTPPTVRMRMQAASRHPQAWSTAAWAGTGRLTGVASLPLMTPPRWLAPPLVAYLADHLPGALVAHGLVLLKDLDIDEIPDEHCMGFRGGGGGGLMVPGGKSALHRQEGLLVTQCAAQGRRKANPKRNPWTLTLTGQVNDDVAAGKEGAGGGG